MSVVNMTLTYSGVGEHSEHRIITHFVGGGEDRI